MKMQKLKKVIVLILVTAALAFFGMGCQSNGDHDHPKADHPKADHDKSDHPK